MNIFKLKNYLRGWIIGNFEPTIFKTDDFEIGVKEYKKGDKEAAHVHKIAQEITVVVSGKFKMNNSILEKGDIVQLAPNEIADFTCLEDGFTTVVKMPSVKGDKYII